MNKQQIGLKLVLDNLEVGVHVDSFQNRLMLQKASYLAQAAGVGMGYYFSWYLHGPYSSALARDAFAISDEFQASSDESEDWELDKRTISKLERVRALITECSITDPAKKLELVASIHFLVTQKGFSPKDTSTLTSALRRFGKECAKREVVSATEGLAKHGFIPN
jgi:hypothetical protein